MGEAQPNQLRAIAADVGFAFVGALLVALILASLSASGVITMALARGLLVVAWLIGVVLTFISAPVWKTTRLHKIIFGLILAALLLSIERYETAHQPHPSLAPPTADQIASKVAAALRPAPASPPSFTKVDLKSLTNRLVARPPPSISLPTQTKTAPSLSMPTQEASLPNISRDNTISLSCYVLSSIPQGSFRAIGLGYGFDTFTNQSNYPMKINSDGPSWECIIRNYGQAIPSLTITIQPKYFHLVKDGAKTFADKEMPIISPGLEELRFDDVPAHGQADPFIIGNISSLLISLPLPSEVKIEDVGLSHEVGIPIIVNPKAPLTMWPNMALMPK